MALSARLHRDAGVSERSAPAALTCAAVLLWLLAFAVFGASGYTLTSERADTWIFFGWINAIEHGQTPSTDWQSPIGALAHYLPWLGHVLAEGYGGALELSGLMAAAILLPCAVVALRRLTPLTAAAVLLAVVAVVVVPWQPGYGAFFLWHGGFYNRWCWAALALLFLFALPAGRERPWIDATALTVLLAFLFFVKMTYFAAGVVFVLGFGFALALFRRAALLAIGGVTVVVAAVQTTTGYVSAYLGDLVDAAYVSAWWSDRRTPFAAVFVRALPQYGIFVAAVLLACAGRCQLVWRSWLCVGFQAAASIAIHAQNAGDASAFGLIAPLALLHEAARDGRRALLSLLGLTFLLTFLPKQAGATYAYASEHPAYRPADLPHMAGVQLLPPQNAPSALVELRSGIDLLRANGINSGMMTLDYANPFPLLMGFTPIPERFLSLMVGRYIDRGTPPSPESLFRHARAVMTPLNLARHPPHRQFLADTYGGWLNANFQLQDENEHWRLFCRRD